MRISNRDQRNIHYKIYSGKVEKTETVGTGQSAVTYRLGEYTLSYGEMQSAWVYVSIPKGMAQATSGNATIEPYGAETSYRRYIISEVDLGMTVESMVWIDAYAGGTTTTTVNGVETTTPIPPDNPDYRVTRIGRSYNHFIYEVKEY